MRSLLVATLAMSLGAGFAASAQNEKGPSPVPEKPGVARESEKGAGKPLNATSYTYQKGERLSLSHGYFDEIVDWMGHQLRTPAEGEHWVYYGDNYLLARVDNGLIIDIVKASWGAGRG